MTVQQLRNAIRNSRIWTIHEYEDDPSFWGNSFAPEFVAFFKVTDTMWVAVGSGDLNDVEDEIYGYLEFDKTLRRPDFAIVEAGLARHFEKMSRRFIRKFRNYIPKRGGEFGLQRGLSGLLDGLQSFPEMAEVATPNVVEFFEALSKLKEEGMHVILTSDEIDA